MTETKYTIEQFEAEFENASPEKKNELLEKAMDTLDIEDPIVKETLIKRHREDLEDLKCQMAIDDNERCVKDIDSGTLETFKCIKSYPGHINTSVGLRYYVKIDDVAPNLREQFLSMVDAGKIGDSAISSILERINGMKSLVYIYSDNGIGTLKKKSLFNSKYGEFSEYFEKVSK